MQRGELFRWIQQKVDAEIGNKSTGEVTFSIRLFDGGIRSVECRVMQSMKLKLVDK